VEEGRMSASRVPCTNRGLRSAPLTLTPHPLTPPHHPHTHTPTGGKGLREGHLLLQGY
jgi:hypothetical protein